MVKALSKWDLYIYNAISAGIFPLFLMYYSASRLFKKKYRESALFRLGLKTPNLSVKTKNSIWIHALSVGETMSAIPLVRAIKSREPSQAIVFSTSTESGQKTAKKRLMNEVVDFVYMPHDFLWAVGNLISSISPRVFITIETDAWPNLLMSLKRRKILSFLVNGRISPKSIKRFMLAGSFSRKLFECFDMCLMQSTDDVDKLLRLGLNPVKVQSAGNLKFDMLPEVHAKKRDIIARDLEIEKSDKILVAGSTHEGEEEIILNVFRRLQPLFKDLRLIVAPRHPERASRIRTSLSKKGISVSLRTRDRGFRGTKILIVDTLGELAYLYSVATLAFIGGSLVPIGGHNPLEALAFGVPTLFGPHMYNFREIERLLIRHGCAERVKDEEDLERIIKQLFKNDHHLKKMGEAARFVVKENQGATQRIIDLIMPYLR